jgi:hypothetical protein
LGSNDPLAFDPQGRNTLYPLIQGFSVLADLCADAEHDPSLLLRPVPALPGYHGKTTLDLFPFLHTMLLLDISPIERTKILGTLRDVTRLLETSQIHHVRNGIDHPRRPGEFPTGDRIAEAIRAVGDVVRQLEQTGICPLIYYFAGSKTDEFDRRLITLQDYARRDVAVHRPSPYTRCDLPPITGPLIVVPALHVGESTEVIRFAYEETSDYVAMWRGYPKRRLRRPTEDTCDVASLEPPSGPQGG